MSYTNEPYSGGKVLQSDDTVIDLEAFLESGQIKAQAVASPSLLETSEDGIVRNYDNFSPVAYKVITPDNTIIDLIEFLTSGQLKVSLEGTIIAAGPIDTNGYPVIDSVNDIVTVDADILKIRNKISGVDTTTYIQFVDDTEIDFFVGNESPLSLMPTQMYVWGLAEFNGGALFSDTTIFAGPTNTFSNDAVFNGSATFNSTATLSTAVVSDHLTLSGTTNQIRSPSGKNIQIAPGGVLDWIELLAEMVNVQSAIIFDSSPLNSITYTNDISHDHEMSFHTNNVKTMILSPSGVNVLSSLTCGGNVIFNGSYLQIEHEILLNSSVAAIRATTGNKVSIESTDINTPIDLVGNYIAVQSAICRRVSNGIYQTGNNITFGNQTQTHNISDTSVFDINASGFRLGTGYRVNNITNSPSSVLDTDIPTMYAVQTAIGNAIIGANPFRGFWDASGGTYPTTGGTGEGGAIEAGNWWRISVAGTLGGEPLDVGDQLFAGTDDPGQTPANWTPVNPRVTSVFGRVGPVVAELGDYSFSLISGNIVTSQLPNSGVNGASQLVQLNASTQLPAVSGVNLTGLTGSLTSSANNLSVSVNGGTASSNVNIVNSISLSSSTNSLTATVNGVSSASVNIINTNVLGVSGTNISSTINGVASNNISIGFSNLTGNIDTEQLPNSGVNGASQLVQLNASTQLPAVSGANLTGLIGALTSSVNNLSVSVNGGTASSNVNIINSNSLTSSTNSLTATINGVASSPVNIVNSISLGLSGNQLTATVNGQSSNAVTISSSQTFTTVTSSTQALAMNSVYYTTYAGLCVMTLPTSANQGELFTITAGPSGSTFKIAQNSGQLMYYGALNGVSQVTTTGTGGYLQSSDPNTSVTVRCVVTNTTFVVENMVNAVTGA